MSESTDMSESTNVNKVPKIIHQLWIGDKPPPINAMNSIRNKNPDYEYNLWNEELIEEKLKIPKRYQRKIENHSAIWGKADMYRYLILEQFGGVFVDADMIAVEPLDDFLLNKAFFCWENEIARPNLCATSLQAYPPHHIIPKTAIDWIMNNNVNIEQTKTPSWELVGPLLLTRTYHELIPDKSVVNVFPSYYALPDHHSGSKYIGHGKVYMSHEWGSTWNSYQKINEMSIPSHHQYPTESITIKISNDSKTKELKEIMKGIKNMEGHFNILIDTKLDINKYLNSMRFVYTTNPDNHLTLTQLMNQEGSDKGQDRHDYTKKYEELFEPIKDEITTFCEIGLGSTNRNIKSNMGKNGTPLASVKAWKRYFNNATIYGADIDMNILENHMGLFTYHIDMTDSESVNSFWKNFTHNMDIILDDGLHEFDANVNLFENSYDKFNKYYIIEDVGENYLAQWRHKLQVWKQNYPNLQFELFINPIETNKHDNNLIIIKKLY